MKTALLSLCLSLFFYLPAYTQFKADSLQLMKDVKVLSSDKMMGRKAGTRGSRKAQFYIKRRFEEIGLNKLFNTYEQPFFFQAKDGRKIMGTNLIGSLEGQTATWIIISAHYDHLGVGAPEDGDSIYNGADDNASGVAGLLALAQYFKAHPPRHNILFVAFDAEEEGLQGSRSFVDHSEGLLHKIKLNINMDMISHSARNELYACGTYQFPQLKPYLASAGEKSKIKLKFGHDGQNPGEANWVQQSDQAAFYAAGIPFIYFGVEDHADYHQASDSFETITASFFYHAVVTIINAVANLDQHLGIQLKIPAKDKWIMQEEK